MARVGSAPVAGGFLSKAMCAAPSRDAGSLLSASLRESSRLRTPSVRAGSGFTAWPGTPGGSTAAPLVDARSAPTASGFSLYGTSPGAGRAPTPKQAGLGVSKKPALTKSQVRGAASHRAAAAVAASAAVISAPPSVALASGPAPGSPRRRARAPHSALRSACAPRCAAGAGGARLARPPARTFPARAHAVCRQNARRHAAATDAAAPAFAAWQPSKPSTGKSSYRGVRQRPWGKVRRLLCDSSCASCAA